MASQLTWVLVEDVLLLVLLVPEPPDEDVGYVVSAVDPGVA